VSSTVCVEGESSNSNSKCFNILYFNARSILPKLDELKVLAEDNNPDTGPAEAKMHQSGKLIIIHYNYNCKAHYL